MSRKITIQLEVRVTVSREVRADSFEEAKAIASEIQPERVIRVKRPYGWEYDQIEVTGMYK